MAGAKGRKTCATKWRVVLVLHVIGRVGWTHGYARVFDQSQIVYNRVINNLRGRRRKREGRDERAKRGRIGRGGIELILTYLPFYGQNTGPPEKTGKKRTLLTVIVPTTELRVL